MGWNLAALVTLAGAALAGLLLFRRYAADGRPHGLVCLRCGAPADALTSFSCPGCGHDVREAGIGAAGRRSPLEPFWHAVLFTTAYLIAALIITRVLIPRIGSALHESYTASVRLSSSDVQGVDVALDARRGSPAPDGRSLFGTLTGDLYATGGVVTLEAELPEARWRLVDLSGHELAAGRGLDGQVIDRWLRAAGVDPDTPAGRAEWAPIAGAVTRISGVRINPPHGAIESAPLSYSTSVGGGSTLRPDPRGVPVIVISLAVLWTAGLWLVLALAGRRGRIDPHHGGPFLGGPGRD